MLPSLSLKRTYTPPFAPLKYGSGYKGMSFEAGAARFHSSHGKLISLIHDLKLEKETVQLPKGIDHLFFSSVTQKGLQVLKDQLWNKINYDPFTDT